LNNGMTDTAGALVSSPFVGSTAFYAIIIAGGVVVLCLIILIIVCAVKSCRKDDDSSDMASSYPVDTAPGTSLREMDPAANEPPQRLEVEWIDDAEGSSE